MEQVIREIIKESFEVFLNNIKNKFNIEEPLNVEDFITLKIEKDTKKETKKCNTKKKLKNKIFNFIESNKPIYECEKVGDKILFNNFIIDEKTNYVICKVDENKQETKLTLSDYELCKELKLNFKVEL